MNAKFVIALLIVASCNLAAAKVIELNEENWEQLLAGEWMVEL